MGSWNTRSGDAETPGIPGSEWRLHRDWFESTAPADLFEGDFSLAAKDTLYRCHDRLLPHTDALFTHLAGRRPEPPD